ncbi:MAG: hypothetical protein E7619_07865 [Ruminococcaceae bacterium]|nr:hypothetical protein [Oscillospiraceae bacterium]
MRVTFLEPRKNLELYLPRLEELIERLIRDYGADTFYFCEMTRFRPNEQKICGRSKPLPYKRKRYDP